MFLLNVSCGLCLSLFFATDTVIGEKSKILIVVSEAGKNSWPEIIFVLKYATGTQQYTERV